jgi:hypothetical protein
LPHVIDEDPVALDRPPTLRVVEPGQIVELGERRGDMG